MDPRNGDVLAMVSNPTFDPNELSSQDLEEVRAAWERLNADPQHAAAVPRERRAVPAGVDVQDGHGVGRARERLRPGQRVAEPARAGPAAHGRHDPELRRRDLPGRRDHHAAHRVHELLQRDLRRGRAAARAGRALGAGARVRLLPDRSARGDRVPGADDPVHDPVRDRTVPDRELLRGERPARRDLRDRTGQRPGQPVADGAGGVRHREPRRDDDASVGDADPRPTGAHHPASSTRSRTASRSRRRPRRICAR